MEPGDRHSWIISIVLLLVGIAVNPAPAQAMNPMDTLLLHNLFMSFLAVLALSWSRITIAVVARKPKTWIVALVIFLVGIALFLHAALIDFGYSGLDPSLAFYIPLVIIGIALCEEFAFRGGIQTILVKVVGAKRGVLAATLIFSLYHVPEYLGYGQLIWLPVGFVFLIGLAAGYLYYRTGNLLLSISLHSAFDFYGLNGLLGFGIYPPELDFAGIASFSVLSAAILVVIAARSQFKPRRRVEVSPPVPAPILSVDAPGCILSAEV